jgi:hypothetical protein
VGDLCKSKSLLLNGEQTTSDKRQFLFEAKVHSIFKGVGNNNSASMRQQNNASTSTSFALFKEDILTDLQIAFVSAIRFSLHRVFKQFLTIF